MTIRVRRRLVIVYSSVVAPAGKLEMVVLYLRLSIVLWSPWQEVWMRMLDVTLFVSETDSYIGRHRDKRPHLGCVPNNLGTMRHDGDR